MPRPFFVLPLLLAACGSRVITIAPGDAEDAAVVVVDAATVVDARTGAPDVPPSTRCIPGTLTSCDGCTIGVGLRSCPDNGVLGPCVCPAPPNYTYDYVLDHLILDPGAEAPGNRGVNGFNLDGRFSPARTADQTPLDCSHGDYFSALDPDQNMGTCVAGMPGGGPGCQGGVDNQLPVIAQTLQQFQATLDFAAGLNEPFGRGRGLMILRVSDVNAGLGPTLNDDAVTVSLYQYVTPRFVECSNLGMSGEIYAVEDRSLTVPGDLSSARLQFSGSIVNGRLRVTPTAESAVTPTFRLSATLMGSDFSINLYQTRFRFSMTGNDGTDGNLGGYVTAADLLDSFGTIPGLMQFRDAARPLIQGFVDVAPGASAATCSTPDGGIGVGLGFIALRAVVDTITVSSPPPSICGH